MAQSFKKITILEHTMGQLNITIKPETKKKLEEAKIIPRETYNDVIERILPLWAEQILKLNQESKQKGAVCSSDVPNNAKERINE